MYGNRLLLPCDDPLKPSLTAEWMRRLDGLPPSKSAESSNDKNIASRLQTISMSSEHHDHKQKETLSNTKRIKCDCFSQFSNYGCDTHSSFWDLEYVYIQQPSDIVLAPYFGNGSAGSENGNYYNNPSDSVIDQSIAVTAELPTSFESKTAPHDIPLRNEEEEKTGLGLSSIVLSRNAASLATSHLVYQPKISSSRFSRLKSGRKGSLPRAATSKFSAKESSTPKNQWNHLTKKKNTIKNQPTKQDSPRTLSSQICKRLLPTRNTLSQFQTPVTVNNSQYTNKQINFGTTHHSSLTANNKVARSESNRVLFKSPFFPFTTSTSPREVWNTKNNEDHNLSPYFISAENQQELPIAESKHKGTFSSALDKENCCKSLTRRSSFVNEIQVLIYLASLRPAFHARDELEMPNRYRAGNSSEFTFVFTGTFLVLLLSLVSIGIGLLVAVAENHRFPIVTSFVRAAGIEILRILGVWKTFEPHHVANLQTESTYDRQPNLGVTHSRESTLMFRSSSKKYKSISEIFLLHESTPDCYLERLLFWILRLFSCAIDDRWNFRAQRSITSDN